MLCSQANPGYTCEHKQIEKRQYKPGFEVV